MTNAITQKVGTDLANPNGFRTAAEVKTSANQTRSKAEEELIRAAHQAAQNFKLQDSTDTAMVNADLAYLLVEYLDDIQTKLNEFREKEFYSVDDFTEKQILLTEKTQDGKVDISMTLDPINDSEFAVTETYRDASNGNELKKFKAQIVIDREHPELSYAKHLEYDLLGEGVLMRTEEDPTENSDGKPDKLMRIDLSPLKRQVESYD